MYDHVLILAQGSPASAGDVKSFLESLTRSKELQTDRIAQRADHFQKIGIVTPYVKSIQALSERLAKALAAFGAPLPVYAAMRHGAPSLKEVIEKAKKSRHSRGLALILSPFKSELTFEAYQQSVEQAQRTAGSMIQYDYLKVKHTHPLYVQAISDKVRYAMRTLTLEQREFVHILFCAPAIPKAIAQLCDYEKEYSTACSLVIKDVGQPKWSMTYKARAGSTEPSIDPELTATMGQLNKEKERHVLLVPMGAVCEGVETLYDLDMDARATVESAGYGFLRAPTVMDHPKFLLMILDILLEKAK